MKGNIKSFGIGTDIETIDRFKKLNLVKDCSFLNSIFTKNELKYCFSKKKAAPHLAARYAGKEAIVKALSSIGKPLFNYKQIEITNNGSGVPTVKINNSDFCNLQARLSLSHCKDKAVAFAIVMKGNFRSSTIT